MVRESIGRILETEAQQRGRREAWVHTQAGVRYTYARLWQEVQRFARGLLQVGIDKGDRVALKAANIPEWMVAFLGTLYAGAVLVPVNPDSTKEELDYILSQSESKCLILDSGPAAEAFETPEKLPSLHRVVAMGHSADPGHLAWKRLMEMGDGVTEGALAARSASVRPEDPVAIMYTSGTTGKPKGVVLDHLGLVNKSLVSTARQGIASKDRLCLFFPCFTCSAIPVSPWPASLKEPPWWPPVSASSRKKF